MGEKIIIGAMGMLFIGIWIVFLIDLWTRDDDPHGRWE